MNKVLFVAVHPDDETLGCGGTILKHKKNQDNIFWLIITKANDDGPLKIAEQQKAYVNEVATAYKFDKVYHLDFTTTKLDTYPLNSLVKQISDVIFEVKPDIIYLPNRTDVHSDHKIAFNAAYSCTKSFRYPFIKKILMYETLSETEFAPPLITDTFAPNYFVEINDYLYQKLEIMKLFTTEQMDKPFPRSLSSIEAQARIRGSRAGVEYAESFVLLYSIN